MTPESFEILVVRELRKVGFDVGAVRIQRRSELAESEHGFVLELAISLTWSGSTSRALVVCLRQSTMIGSDIVQSVKARLTQMPADMGLIFAVPGFAAEAVAAAREVGVALLRVVDGRSVVDHSSGESPGHYPAWLPTHLVQLVDRDSAGQLRARLLEPGRPDMILDCLARTT